MHPGGQGVFSAKEDTKNVIFEIGSGSYTFATLGKRSQSQCVSAKEGNKIDIKCPVGHTISSIPFASFGSHPRGSCGTLSKGLYFPLMLEVQEFNCYFIKGLHYRKQQGGGGTRVPRQIILFDKSTRKGLSCRRSMSSQKLHAESAYSRVCVHCIESNSKENFLYYYFFPIASQR